MYSNVRKKFSIGVNFNESEENFTTFLEEYCEFLSSMYFSIPLGRKYYSRKELEDEYTDVKKVLRYIELLTKFNIRKEITFNSYGLKEEDIVRGCEYIKNTMGPVEEIVCLNEYAEIIRDFFPEVELKYSFNNIRIVDNDLFNTYVVGKTYLKDMHARHSIIDSGYNIVLLLNNGCSLNCATTQCGSTYCRELFHYNLKTKDINELYAIQTLLPDELDKIFRWDPLANSYRLKISNRPLGLDFTKRVLDAYIGFSELEESFWEEKDNLCLFCTLGCLYEKRDMLQYSEIIRYKNKIKGE